MAQIIYHIQYFKQQYFKLNILIYAVRVILSEAFIPAALDKVIGTPEIFLRPINVHEHGFVMVIVEVLVTFANVPAVIAAGVENVVPGNGILAS